MFIWSCDNWLFWSSFSQLIKYWWMNDWKAEQGGDWLRVKGIVFKVGTVFRLSRGIVFRLFNQTSIQSRRILSSPFLKDQFQTRLSDLQESSASASQCDTYTETQFYSKIDWTWQKGPRSSFHKCVVSHRIKNAEYKIQNLHNLQHSSIQRDFVISWSP